MKTHYEPVGDFLTKEVIDEWDVYECDKGHKWEETLENHFGVPLPIAFPAPGGENVCPYCFGELLSKLGKVSIRQVKAELGEGK